MLTLGLGYMIRVGARIRVRGTVRVGALVMTWDRFRAIGLVQCDGYI